MAYLERHLLPAAFKAIVERPSSILPRIMTSYPPQLNFRQGSIVRRLGYTVSLEEIRRPRQVYGGVNRYCKISHLKFWLWSGLNVFRSQYWAYVSYEMQNIRAKTYNNLRKGTIRRSLPYYVKWRIIDSIYTSDFSQPNASSPVQDISDLGFWDVDYRFMTNTMVVNEQNTFHGSWVGIFYPGEHHYSPSVSNLASNNASPNIWIASDSLAKSYYSTIMTDLGQTTAAPNILLNETALHYFTRNFTYMQNHTVNAQPGPANDSYETLKDQTGPLNTSAAVISTKYLCQVPRRKSTGTLFLSILVADLVFMQVLWKILNLCSVAWLTRKDPKGQQGSYCCIDAFARADLTLIANCCPGCLGRTSIALAPLDASVHEEESPLKSPVYDMRAHDPHD